MASGEEIRATIEAALRIPTCWSPPARAAALDALRSAVVLSQDEVEQLRAVPPLICAKCLGLLA